MNAARLFALGALLALTSACSTPKINLWPFGTADSAVGNRGIENATAYACDNGKTFYVRLLESGQAVWVILPDRQVRLDRSTADASRYSNGISVLKLDGATADLTDGPSTSYLRCKNGAEAAKR